MELVAKFVSDQSYALAKRLFDIFFSLFALVIFAPFFVLIGTILKVSSKGPIFYKSRRLGKDFKDIYCLKFRTMHTLADQKLFDLLEKHPSLKKEWQLYQKLKDDPRIHPFGKFLRKTSLDEIPQFLNVLKGDLSLVGPRPFDSNQVEKYLGKKAKKFLSVKPGLTGLWQVSGRNLLTMHERLLMEEYYIDHKSFLMDLKLVLKTIPVFFFPKGAF